MIRRRVFLSALGLGIVSAPHAGHAQQGKRAPRIGVISSWSPSEPATAVDGVRRGLRDVGYQASDSIQFEYRTYDDRFPARANELASLNVDVIIVTLTADTGELTANGYRLEVACSCGVTFERWIALREAANGPAILAPLN